MKMRTKLLCWLMLGASSALAQSGSAANDSEEMMKKSISQLAAALSVQRGLANDPICSNQKYEKISIDEWVDLVAEIDKRKSKSDKSDAEKEKLKDVIYNLMNSEVSGKKLRWELIYELSRKEHDKLQLSDDQLCNRLNASALIVFKRSLSTMKLVK